MVAECTSSMEGDIAMEKLVDRAKVKVKGMVDHIEGTLKRISYKADMAAKTVATIAKGILKGQHRP
jgi:hypothetical protein